MLEIKGRDERSERKSQSESERVSASYQSVFDLWINTCKSLQSTNADIVARSADVWQKMVEDSTQPLTNVASSVIKNTGTFETEQVRIIGNTIRDVAESWHKNLTENSKTRRSRSSP